MFLLCRSLPRRAFIVAAFAAFAALAGCAQAPQTQQLAAGHGKEYFPSSVYGPASRRVVADGQPIPHGGGQYLVGKPYTVAGQTYYPSERAVRQVGLASWYGDAFHGRLTANGEVYDRDGFTAAHPTMPLPSYARVTNLRNHYTMVVRVNDRGPYHAGRIMDVSRRVAEALDFQRGGTAKIKVEYVGHASLAGSDDAKLYATLRRDENAGPEERSLLAEAAPQAAPIRTASLAPVVADTRGDEEDARRQRSPARRDAQREMRREARQERASERREADDARHGKAEVRRERDDVERERAEARRERDGRDGRDGQGVPPRGARPGEPRHEVAELHRAGGTDRRRLAELAAEAPAPGRRDDGGGADRRSEDRHGERLVRSARDDRDALPPPRPPARARTPERAADEGRSGGPMPPRRLRIASAEPLHKAGGMHLTRSRED